MSKQKIILYIFLSLGIISVFNSLSSASDDSFWYRDGELENWMINVINVSVVYLTNDTQGTSITGTLVSTEKKAVYVLTNYHILKSTTDEVNLYLTNEENKLNKYPCHFIKGDQKLDLALFSWSFPAKDRNLIVKYNNWIAKSSYAENNMITKGKIVLFLGFPLQQGIDVQKIIQPIKLQETGEIITRELRYPIRKNAICRYGRIASDQLSSGTFLIDAMVSHGNSGSPVFVRTGYQVSTSTSIGTISSYALAGVIKGAFPDYIEYTSETGQKIFLDQNSGLGIVISIDTIKEFLKDE